MPPNLEKISRALTELLPSVGDVLEAVEVGGGCISKAQRVVVRDHCGAEASLLVKSNDPSFAANFEAEWQGLVRLRAAAAIAVPEPVAIGSAHGAAWLVTEWIDNRPPGGAFYRDFGTALATLHRVTVGSEIGLDHDNFLGSARQVNRRCESWIEFVADHRIGFQLRWAVDQGVADSRLRQEIEQIIAGLSRLLAGRDETTSLLHGDLWSGNYLCSATGAPAIIDPAIYHGCREAEFGMLRLFGGCPSDFYDAYLAAFPLPDGWQRRTSVYVLYHLLNHLNLFGTSYLGQCKSVAGEIMRS